MKTVWVMLKTLGRPSIPREQGLVQPSVGGHRIQSPMAGKTLLWLKTVVAVADAAAVVVVVLVVEAVVVAVEHWVSPAPLIHGMSEVAGVKHFPRNRKAQHLPLPHLFVRTAAQMVVAVAAEAVEEVEKAAATGWFGTVAACSLKSGAVRAEGMTVVAAAPVRNRHCSYQKQTSASQALAFCPLGIWVDYW